MIFERIKALYKAGIIKSLKAYVEKGLITEEQAKEIMAK